MHHIQALLTRMLGRRVEYYNGLAFGYQNMQRDIEVKECQRTHEAAKGTVSFGKMLEMPAVFTIQMSSECVAMNEGSIRNRQGIERTFQLLATLIECKGLHKLHSDSMHM